MTITMSGICPLCGKVSFVDVDEGAWHAYEAGALIQDAFPTMDPMTRELLLSGMCEDCQATFFEEDDEDCDGECDVCMDFDCPSNASYFGSYEE